MRVSLPHWFLLTLLAAGAVAISPASAQQGTPSLKRGEALLTTNCARCHATGTAGASPHPAAPPFRTLARKYPIDGLQEALAEGLSVGHPDMPEFVFEPADISAILAYLKSIQER
jgi:cytochrome c